MTEKTSKLLGVDLVVGIDIETTGLSHAECGVLEVHARLIDPSALREGRAASEPIFNRVCWPKGVKWERKAAEMHAESGLLAEACQDGTRAEGEVLRAFAHLLCELRAEHRARKVVLLGSSVHFDRTFLLARKPSFDLIFHRRVIDVSAVHLFMDLSGVPADWPKKQRAHRARDDLAETFLEMTTAVAALRRNG